MSDLPTGWVCALADQIKANSPNALAIGPFGSNLKVSDYRDAGVPLVFVRNIRAKAFDAADFKFVSTAKAESLHSHRVKQGDVLLTKMGDPPGDATIYPLAEDGIITADCIKLTPHSSINARYLMYAVSSPKVKRQILQITQGVAQPKMSLDRFRNSVEIPLAPSAEQQRIVAAIEEQFSRLDVAEGAMRRIRQNLKRMRAAVLENAIAGNSSTSFGRTQFGDLLREPLRNGHSAKVDPAGSVRIWSLTAVTNGDFSPQNTKLTSADPKRVRDLWVQPGDLLIERSNTPELVGTARLYDGPPNVAVFPDLVIRARVSDCVLPRFAELVLQAPSSRRYFQRRAQGISGSMPKIDQATIEGLSLYLPSLDAQINLLQSTERQLSAIELLEGELKNASTCSARIRSSILAAAFSGKLVHQDQTDEPASVFLERIAADRATFNRHPAARSRMPRTKVTT